MIQLCLCCVVGLVEKIESFSTSLSALIVVSHDALDVTISASKLHFILPSRHDPHNHDVLDVTIVGSYSRTISIASGPMPKGSVYITPVHPRVPAYFLAKNPSSFSIHFHSFFDSIHNELQPQYPGIVFRSWGLRVFLPEWQSRGPYGRTTSELFRSPCR